MPDVVTWSVIGGLIVFGVGMVSAISARKRGQLELGRKTRTVSQSPLRGETEGSHVSPTAEQMAGKGLDNLKEPKTIKDGTLAAAGNTSR